MPFGGFIHLWRVMQVYFVRLDMRQANIPDSFSDQQSNGIGEQDESQGFLQIGSEFVHDPLSQFVKCLRIYCQHYKSPNIYVKTSIQNGKVTRQYNLSKADLESFDGWSATAKRYLQGGEDTVDIVQVAKKYWAKVISFYTWFQQKQEEIHSKELELFREKETELHRLALFERYTMC